MSEPNRVSVSLGFTKNLGNFETMRIDVGLASDKLDSETTADCFRRVETFVQKALVEAVENAVNAVQ